MRQVLQRTRPNVRPLATRLPFHSNAYAAYPRSSRRNMLVQQLSSSAAPPSNEPEAEDNQIRRRQSTRKTSISGQMSQDALEEHSQRESITQPLWHSAGDAGEEPSSSNSDSATLSSTVSLPGTPSSWLVDEAYQALLLTLHPRIQHQATYSTDNSPLLEPILTLYCPIEGGDYSIDATVREIARKANADVVMIDALDIAAGEHGRYGAAASSFQFPQHPLHFVSTSPVDSSSSSKPVKEEDEDDGSEEDDDGPVIYNGSPTSFTIQVPMSGGPLGQPVMRPSRVTSSSSSLTPASRGPAASLSRARRSFFESLINVPSSTESDSRRPRIIYIRDFPLIAGQASQWYNALLAEVKARRQGPISRPTSPVHPTTIIFGVTPPYTAQSPTPQPRSNPTDIMSMLRGDRRPPPPAPVDDYSESDQLSRERRLRERLRKWQKGSGWLRDELPAFNPSAPSSQKSSSRTPFSDMSAFLGPNVIAVPMGREGNGDSGSLPKDGYHTIVGVVPETRSPEAEALARQARRFKLNAVSFRMALAESGAVLAEDMHLGLAGSEELRAHRKWHLAMDDWRALRLLADDVVGNVLRQRGFIASENPLDLVPVTWEEVIECVVRYGAMGDMRKTWVEEQAVKDASSGTVEGAKVALPVDEVLEAVRRDPNLDQHEQRLLGCIVDPATMPTTFDSVHLPAGTIDSVRTMVSLPLLYPDAFSSGILKTHAMTGALLFGPPGTGKTLLARAIARESGARMLIVKSSDILDMYVGEGEKLVRSLFTLARKLSPCVIFIDEIDALFGTRISSRDTGGASAHRGVLTEFMQEMDGLKSVSDSNVIVIGATNRPFDLDDAVLRRLPRRLLLDLPGPKQREEILKILLRDETLDSNLDLKDIAKQTDSFSGSDLKHLCVSAALDAIKETVTVPWAVISSSPESSQEAAATMSSSLDVMSENSSAPSSSNDSSTSETNTTTNSSESQTISESSTPSKEGKSEDTTAVTLDASSPNSTSPLSIPKRILHTRHFKKALTEISPSASESMGTLAAIRKWNAQFGEGAKDKPKKAWGENFGFNVLPPADAPPAAGVGASPAA